MSTFSREFRIFFQTHHWRFCLFISYIFVFITLPAQEPIYTRYTIRDGLPSNWVYSAMQDSEGYIWFSTTGGISKWDGYSFRNYTTRDGLPDNEIFEIYEDRRGRLWLRTLNGKLCFYDNGKFHTGDDTPVFRGVQTSKNHEHIFEDKRGDIWILDSGNDVIHIDRDLEFVKKVSVPGWVNVIREDKQGNVIITNRFSQAKINGDSLEGDWKGDIPELVRSKRYQDLKLRKSSNSNRYWGHYDSLIYLVSNDRLIQTTDGLLKPGKNTNRYFDTGMGVIYLGEDRMGNMWLGTIIHGAIMLESGMDSWRERQQFLKGKKVNGVFQDNELNYWFCTLDGVYFCPELNVKSFFKGNGLLENDIMTLINFPGGGILAGGKRNSISLIRDNQILNFPLEFTPLPHHEIYCILHQQQSRFLIGGGLGLVEISIEPGKPLAAEQEYILTGKPIRMDRTFDGKLWIGTERGIIREEILDKIQKKPEMRHDSSIFKLYRHRIHSMETAPENRLWVGTNKGLFEYVNGEFHKLEQVAEYLENGRPSDLFWSGGDSLWIGTYGNGVLLLTDKGVRQFSDPANSTGNICNAIALDEQGDLWAATFNGVVKYSFPTGHSSPEITWFDRSDGLVSNVINDILIEDENIWVASSEGISLFQESISKNRPDSPPKVHLETLKVNDEVIYPGDSNQFSYDQNSLSFGFVGLSFRSLGKITYKYRMEGLDTTWHFTQNTIVEYPSLPPGTYDFQVLAQSYNGVWSQSPASFAFSISSPFWQRWWFYVMVLFSGFSLLSGGFLLYIRNTRRKNEFERKIRQSEQNALRAQMNPHFIFNSMSSIQRYVIENKSDEAVEYLGEFGALIRQILENSKSPYITLQEETEFLEMYLTLEAMRLEHTFDFEVRCPAEIRATGIKIPSMLIQPFVENSIWHGVSKLSSQGHILVEFSGDHSTVTCIITDNGIGRKEAERLSQKGNKRWKSRGMQIITERIELLNQGKKERIELDIEDLLLPDGQAAGTRVHIRIPVIHPS